MDVSASVSLGFFFCSDIFLNDVETYYHEDEDFSPQCVGAVRRTTVSFMPGAIFAKNLWGKATNLEVAPAASCWETDAVGVDSRITKVPLIAVKRSNAP